MPERRLPGIEKRRRTDGTTGYRVSWREGGTRDGARRSRTVDREGEAKALRAAIVANGYRLPEQLPTAVPAPAAPPSAAGPTFADYGRARVAALTGVGAGWRASTRADLERHMAPAFGGLPLAEVDDTAVRSWLRGMETAAHPWLHDPRCAYADTAGRAACTHDCRPLAPRTRRRLVTQASAIAAAAVRDRLLDRNPFEGIRIGRSDHDRHDEQVVLTGEEWALLRAHLPAGPNRAVADLAVATGARWGELTALAIRHVVEVPAPAVRITRAWQRTETGGHALGDTKSRRSRRTVTFDRGTLELLAEQLAGRPEDALLFTGPQGARLSPSNYWRRVWQPALDAAAADGLAKRPRFHDLRHTHVSWLIAANVPLAVIQRRLGHESITTTIDTYGHMLPTAEAEAVSAIEAALRRPVDDTA